MTDQIKLQTGSRQILLLTLFSAVLTLSLGSASLFSNDTQRRPLDLPSGGQRGDDSSDDSANTPDQVQFYGQSFEGDSFVWCLDKSGSMGHDGRMQLLKDEMLLTLASLSSRTQFDLVAFSTGHEAWSGRLMKAAFRESAMAWVQELEPNGLTCLGVAVVESLEILAKSTDRHRNLILVGDGMPFCGSGGPSLEETMGYILNHNWQRLPISTIFLGNEPEGEEFMRKLALHTGGVFVHQH